MISLLCPSRGREQNIIKLRVNILSTVYNIFDIELLLKMDEDNLYPIDSSHSFIRPFIAERSEWLNKDYYNYLASEAKGQYLFSIGDDVRFKTVGWDKILSEKIEEYLKDKPDRIAYISVSEKGSKAKHPCFPLITKEAFNVLGMYFHPELMSWGADRCIWEIYSNPKINRILHIPEIEIEHISYHDNKAPFDETAKSMKERFFRDPQAHNKVSMYVIPQQIQLLEKYIKEYKNVG